MRKPSKSTRTSVTFFSSGSEGGKGSGKDRSRKGKTTKSSLVEFLFLGPTSLLLDPLLTF